MKKENKEDLISQMEASAQDGARQSYKAKKAVEFKAASDELTAEGYPSGAAHEFSVTFLSGFDEALALVRELATVDVQGHPKYVTLVVRAVMRSAVSAMEKHLESRMDTMEVTQEELDECRK